MVGVGSGSRRIAVWAPISDRRCGRLRYPEGLRRDGWWGRTRSRRGDGERGRVGPGASAGAGASAGVGVGAGVVSMLPGVGVEGSVGVAGMLILCPLPVMRKTGRCGWFEKKVVGGSAVSRVAFAEGWHGA